MNLFKDNCDTDLKFTVNQDYAKRYDRWRRSEELQKLKDRYGDKIEDSEESSTSEEEDEDAKELTEDVEKNFFKTLSCLKEKNPKIYDKNVRFFDSKSTEEVEERGKKRKAEPSMSLGEYQRKVLLEKQGKFSDDEDEEKHLKGMTNVELEKSLKESFNNVLKDSDSDNDGENWGGLFKKRVKTEKELQAEEDDFRSWLAGEKERLKNKEQEKDLRGLHDYWSDPKLDEGERFLRDYILNKRFLEKDRNDGIPSYDEVVHDSDSGLSADENTLEQQEEFERKYNFRFEEPDQEFIKRYPRTLEFSMRKKDDKRKKHREEVRVRKEKEKAKKAEELKRLKSLKRKEIMEKIKKLQEITGNEDMGFEKNDLEGDFDPDEHDKRMQELFNDDYYGTCQDAVKPEDPELDKELEIENWDEWGGGEGEGQGEEEELHCEDPGFNMDCDYDPSQDKKFENDMIESTKKRKRRRKSKFAAAVAKEKPVFDPNDKTFEKYVDEYYALDYEDLIGDLPCRFKYRKTVPNDYGLSVEEILTAPDKELNRWVSLKKVIQRRPEYKEMFEVKAYKKKSQDFEKKKKCLPSVYAPEVANAETETTPSNTVKKEKVKKQPEAASESSNNPEEVIEKKEEIENNLDNSDEHQNSSKEKKKKKMKNKEKNSSKEKKKKKKNKMKSEQKSGEDQNNSSEKKKNKMKNKQNNFSKSQNNFNEKKENKNKFNNWQKKKTGEIELCVTDRRLKSYGFNPKKFKHELKYRNRNPTMFPPEMAF